MNINVDELKKTLEKLQQIKEAVSKSDHDALSVDPDSDFEPDGESLANWFESYNLPLACDDTELPHEYLSSVFNTDEVDDDLAALEEYKNLLEVYSDVYSDIYTACMEECAYYEREAQDHERYLDSMRGPL